LKKIIYIGAKGLVGTEFVKAYGSVFDISQIDIENIDNIESYLTDKYDWLICSIHSRSAKASFLNKELFNDHLVVVQKIFELAINKVKNAIYFSTGSVYKLGPSVFSIDSPLDYQTNNAYIKSKIMAEMLACSYSAFFERLFILRPFYIYGLGQKNSMLIPSIIDKVRNQIPITIGKDGGLCINPIHAKDVVKSIFHLVNEEDKIGLKFFNLCGENIISLEEIIQYIGRQLHLDVNITIENKDLVECVAESNIILHQSISIFDGLSQMIDEN
jgi:nucleoside-diphosphate-sugar epimerase